LHHGCLGMDAPDHDLLGRSMMLEVTIRICLRPHTTLLLTPSLIAADAFILDLSTCQAAR